MICLYRLYGVFRQSMFYLNTLREGVRQIASQKLYRQIESRVG
jgi:hypothetical protein